MEADERAVFRRAEILVRSADVEEQRQGKDLLARLSGSSQTEVAVKALNLLLRAAAPPALRHDPPVEAMMDGWSALRSPLQERPLDGRFASWFDDAEAQPDVLHRFAPRMIETVAGWLGEYERALAHDLADPRIAVFEEWSRIAARHPAAAGLLRELLEKAKELKARRIVALCERDVATALREGDVKASWAKFAEIDTLEYARAEDVTRVREMIDHVARLREDIDQWCAYLPLAARSRADVAHIHEVIRRGRALLTAGQAPFAWLEEIRSRLARMRDFVAVFVADRAAAVQTIEAFHDVIAELRTDVAGDSESEAWLQPLAASIEALLAREVEVAQAPAALRRLARIAAELASALPAETAGRLRLETQRLEEVATAWERVESGQSAAAAPAEAMEGAIPGRFREMIGTFARLSQSVQAARRLIEQPGSTGQRMEACREAVAALEEIVRQEPDYAAAADLLRIARARIEHLRLDESIERWDLDKIRAASGSGIMWDPPYAQMFGRIGVLDELDKLRQMLADYSDLQSAETWWTLWRATEASLPDWKPDSLVRALLRVRNDFADSLKASVDDYLRAPTTIDDDRVAEKTIVPIAEELRLEEASEALKRRREIHERVEDARHAGIGPLAGVLREQWGFVSRSLPQSTEILLQAIERAWNEEDREALGALREVGRRALTQDGEPRLKEWLDWLVIEECVWGGATPEGVAGLLSCLQSHPRSSTRRRLERLINRWGARGDLSALTWAYRALSHIEPPLMPGSDPLQELRAETEKVVASVREACRVVESVDSAFVGAQEQETKAAAEWWNRLEQLLLAAPPRIQPGGWPNRPEELDQIAVLVASIQDVINGIASLSGIDLRTASERWDRLDRLVRRSMAEFPFSESMRQSLRRSGPLTKLEFLERQFKRACEECGLEAAVDRRNAFARAADDLQQIVDAFQGTEPESSYTRDVMGLEYWRDVPPLAGDLLPAPAAADLPALIERLRMLEANEQDFRTAIDRLWSERPPVGTSGTFDPKMHRKYLLSCPHERPMSVRVWMLFRNLAERQPMHAILREGRDALPSWVGIYLDRRAKGLQPW